MTENFRLTRPLCQNWFIKDVQWFVPLWSCLSRHAFSVPLCSILLALGSRQGNLTDVVVNADMWPRRSSNRQNPWQWYFPFTTVPLHDADRPFCSLEVFLSFPLSACMNHSAIGLWNCSILSDMFRMGRSGADWNRQCVVKAAILKTLTVMGKWLIP